MIGRRPRAHIERLARDEALGIRGEPHSAVGELDEVNRDRLRSAPGEMGRLKVGGAGRQTPVWTTSRAAVRIRHR